MSKIKDTKKLASLVTKTLLKKLALHVTFANHDCEKVKKLLKIRMDNKSTMDGKARAAAVVIVMLLKQQFNNSDMNRIVEPLTKDIKKAFSSYRMTKKGKGKFLGKNKKWWHNFGVGFAKGFKSVMKPGAKVLAGVATATGQPEFSVPLNVLSNAL